MHVQGPSDTPGDSLGARLRASRLERGIGVRELARRLDLSPSAISQIETGKIQPSVRTLYALAAEIGLSMNDALFDDEPVRSRAKDEAARPEILLDSGSAPAVQRADSRRAIQLSSGVLEAGDAITFRSSTPHRLSNRGSEPVHAVWVVRGRRGQAPGVRV